MPQREPALLWLRDFALTALVLALCTLTSWVFFRLDFVSSNYILTYILGVMYINVFTSGLVYGVVASLFSVMLVNYMFIDPFMQFRIRSDDMVTALVMLCVSLLCSSLTGRIKVQAAQSERKAYASQVLLEASRSLLGAEDPDTILRITATQLGKLLERRSALPPHRSTLHGNPDSAPAQPRRITAVARRCMNSAPMSTIWHYPSWMCVPWRWKKKPPTAPGAKLRKPPARNSCAPTCCAASAMTCAPR